jgi:hypothetical protein
MSKCITDLALSKSSVRSFYLGEFLRDIECLWYRNFSKLIYNVCSSGRRSVDQGIIPCFSLPKSRPLVSGQQTEHKFWQFLINPWRNYPSHVPHCWEHLFMIHMKLSWSDHKLLPYLPCILDAYSVHNFSNRGAPMSNFTPCV